MTKRLVLTFLICSGCAGGSSETATTELVYWPPPGKHDVRLASVLVDRWNRANPSTPVKMQPLPAGRSSEEVLLASMVGGTTPDVCSNILPGTVERMIRAAAVVPLSQFSDFETHISERSPAGTRAAFTAADGEVYQLPYKSNPMALIYNTAHFAAAGIRELPRTYSEFRAVANKLTRDTDGDGRVDHWAIALHLDNAWFKRFDDMYALYIAASGGQTLIQDGRLQIDSEAMLSAVTFLRDLFQRGHTPHSFFAHERFLQGEVSMLAGSAPSIPGIEVRGLKEWGFMQMPVPDAHRGPAYTYGDTKSIVIFSTAGPRKEAAWRFVKFITSPQADLELLRITRQLPMRKDLATQQPFAAWFEEHPRMTKLARMLEHVRGLDDTIHLVEMFDALSVVYEASVTHDIKTPAVALREAQDRMQRVMDVWE